MRRTLCQCEEIACLPFLHLITVRFHSFFSSALIILVWTFFIIIIIIIILFIFFSAIHLFHLFYFNTAVAMFILYWSVRPKIFHDEPKTLENYFSMN